MRAEKGSFPLFMIDIRENGVNSTVFAWTQEEADSIVNEAAQRINAAQQAAASQNEECDANDAPVVEEAKANEVQYDEEGNVIAGVEEAPQKLEDINCVRLPESAALEELAARLHEQGFDIQSLYCNDGPVVEIIDEKLGSAVPVNSLQGLCDAVTAQGRKGISIQRYKGLGEMDASELAETTMHPATRSMIQVTVEDAEMADKTFDLLMGPNVAPRRAFIEENADSVLNPDI